MGAGRKRIKDRRTAQVVLIGAAVAIALVVTRMVAQADPGETVDVSGAGVSVDTSVSAASSVVENTPTSSSLVGGHDVEASGVSSTSLAGSLSEAVEVDVAVGEEAAVTASVGESAVSVVVASSTTAVPPSPPPSSAAPPAPPAASVAPVPEEAPVPAAPVGPTALGVVVDGAGVRLEWGAASGEVSGYRVLRDGVVLAELGASARSYHDAAPPQGRSVEYVVVAFGPGGQAAGSGRATVQVDAASSGSTVGSSVSQVVTSSATATSGGGSNVVSSSAVNSFG